MLFACSSHALPKKLMQYSSSPRRGSGRKCRLEGPPPSTLLRARTPHPRQPRPPCPGASPTLWQGEEEGDPANGSWGQTHIGGLSIFVELEPDNRSQDHQIELKVVNASHYRCFALVLLLDPDCCLQEHGTSEEMWTALASDGGNIYGLSGFPFVIIEGASFSAFQDWTPSCPVMAHNLRFALDLYSHPLLNLGRSLFPFPSPSFQMLFSHQGCVSEDFGREF